MVWCGLLSAALLACEPGPTDLRAWQLSATGPVKLEAVLQGSYDNSLRASAALSLLTLEREDTDGAAMALSTLRALPSPQRDQVGRAMLPALEARLLAPSGRALQGPHTRRLKSFCQNLAPLLSPAVAEPLGAILVRWYLADFPTRDNQKESSLRELVSQLGPAVAQHLVQGLKRDAATGALRPLSALVAAHGSPKTRSRAAVALLEVERSIRSVDHLRRLEKTVRQELSRGLRANEQVDAQVVRLRAESRQRSFLKSEVLPSMGLLALQPSIATRLLALASAPGESTPHGQRLQALELLKDKVADDQLSSLLSLALDEAQAVSLRTLALERSGEVAGEPALPALLSLMRDRRHRELRQPAGELVLQISGASGLSAFFRNLPNGWAMEYAADELDAYSKRINALPESRATLRFMMDKIYSVRWWKRVLGLRYLARHGELAELWRVRRQFNEAMTVRGPGWPSNHTIGKEAQAAITVARRRLALPRSMRDQPPPAATASRDAPPT